MQGASAKTPKINPQMQPNGFPTLTQETQRPFESPDTGMPFGEGPGPAEVGLGLGTGDPESPQKKDLQRLTTLLPMIERAALTADAPESLRTFVKYLKGSKTETINRDLTQGA
jgi:hypothetical protein